MDQLNDHSKQILHKDFIEATQNAYGRKYSVQDVKPDSLQGESRKISFILTWFLKTNMIHILKINFSQLLIAKNGHKIKSLPILKCCTSVLNDENDTKCNQNMFSFYLI